jgi:hypothetical protein
MVSNLKAVKYLRCAGGSEQCNTYSLLEFPMASKAPALTKLVRKVDASMGHEQEF